MRELLGEFRLATASDREPSFCRAKVLRTLLMAVYALTSASFHPSPSVDSSARGRARALITFEAKALHF